MVVQHSEVTPVELEFFADESKRVFLFHVMKGDRMMAEKVKIKAHFGFSKKFLVLRTRYDVPSLRFTEHKLLQNDFLAIITS